MPSASILVIAIAILIGLLLGSFFNVCIYRVPRDLSVVTPRSACVNCGATIAWYDNVPVLSYLALRGRCRSCSARISARYPLVELTTGVVFGVVALRYGTSAAGIKWALLECLMVVLFWTDLEDRILPDEFTIGGTVLGFVCAAFVPIGGVFDFLLQSWPLYARSLASAGVGAVVLSLPVWLMGWLYYRLRHREGLGFGDVKLLALIGVFLGLETGIVALMIGTIAGALVGGAFVLAKRRSAGTYELPFGSFLCAGAAIMPLIQHI